MAEQNGENVVESPSTETHEQGEPSVETEKTEARPEQEHMIPKSRLDEVISQRNDARTEIEQMRERLEALETRTQEPTEEPSPPDSANEFERAKWYIETYGRDAAIKLIEQRLGQPLDQVAGMLKTLPQTTRHAEEAQWERLCQTHSVDPRNEQLQTYVIGAVKGRGMKLDDAIKQAASIFKSEPAEPQPEAPAASVETTPGVSGGRVMVNRPRDARHAADLAQKGVKVPHVPSDQIIADYLKGVRDRRS